MKNNTNDFDDYKFISIHESEIKLLKKPVRQFIEDYSSIEVLLQCDIKYEELKLFIVQRLKKEFHDEVVKLIEAIKEAKADRHETLHLYDC